MELKSTLDALPDGDPIIVDGEDTGESATSKARESFHVELQQLTRLTNRFHYAADWDWEQKSIDDWREERKRHKEWEQRNNPEPPEVLEVQATFRRLANAG